jgi:hypothetical protein
MYLALFDIQSANSLHLKSGGTAIATSHLRYNLVCDAQYLVEICLLSPTTLCNASARACHKETSLFRSFVTHNAGPVKLCSNGGGTPTCSLTEGCSPLSSLSKILVRLIWALHHPFSTVSLNSMQPPKNILTCLCTLPVLRLGVACRFQPSPPNRMVPGKQYSAVGQHNQPHPD